MPQRLRLVCHCLNKARMRMAQRVHGDARAHVQKSAARIVHKPGASPFTKVRGARE